MPTEELENELRRAFARAAADIQDPQQARQRLLQRNYRPGRGHRRLAAGTTAATVAAAVVLGLGLSGAFGSAQTSGTSTIRTTAFTLISNANGTATLTINPRVLLEPATLQADLQQDGIPALVTTGSFCSSDPIPAGFAQVVSGPTGTPPTVTINPAAMPAGTELSFGTFQYSSTRTDTEIELIDTKSHTCSRALPAPPSSGHGVLLIGNGSGMGIPAGS
ncbi:MAG TPA: hypothetical protein VMA72_28260 [Streptosporangiaceae bacterium]|nr:hypothetical protein [Streptosporangiaceae bacterium]